MVLSDHPAVTATLKNERIISYLEADALPVPDWIVQDIDAPIKIPQEDKKVLVHVASLSRTTLIGLDERVSALTARLLPPLTPPPTQPGAEGSRKRPRVDSAPPQRFPGVLAYVVDLADGLESVLKMNPKGRTGLVEGFAKAFPGYTAAHQTAYRYKADYKKAKDTGILQRFINYGRTPEGKWGELTKGECPYTIFGAHH